MYMLIGKWISGHPKFVGSLVQTQNRRLLDEKRDLVTIAYYVWCIYISFCVKDCLRM